MNKLLVELLVLAKLTRDRVSEEGLKEEYDKRYIKGYGIYRSKIVNGVFNGNGYKYYYNCDKEQYYEQRSHYRTLYDTHEQIKKQVKEYNEKYFVQWGMRLRWNNWRVERICGY